MTSDVDLVRKKLVVVGNGNVGKTSLLYAFKDNRFCQDYVPTLFEGNTHHHFDICKVVLILYCSENIVMYFLEFNRKIAFLSVFLLKNKRTKTRIF